MSILSAVTLPTDGATVSVPSGAQVALLFWQYWSYTPPDGLTSASIGGQSFTERTETVSTGSTLAVGAATAVVSGSGNQTFNIDLSGSSDIYEGPVGFLVFIDEVDTGDFFRAANSTAVAGSNPASTSAAMEATDLVIGMNGGFIGSPPDNESGWTSVSTHTNNGDSARLRTLDSPSSGTATINAQATLYEATVALLTIKAASATLIQEGFRWGIDDGSESTHSWDEDQDTNITAPATEARLINFLVDLTGDPGVTTLKAQQSLDGVDDWADIPVE